MQLKNLNNLLELFFQQYKIQNKNSIFLSSLKNKDEVYSWEKTFKSIINLSETISKYINKGDRCLLISENRPEWFISDMSIMLSGGITVPAYTTYIEKDYEYIIDDCKPSIIIFSNFEQYIKIKNVLNRKDFIKKVFYFDKSEKIKEDDFIYLDNILKKNNLNYENFKDCELFRKDPACIIYTSGTQGNPKGVMLSHGGILSNCQGALNLLSPLITNQMRFLTWLPLSHSYEHTVQFVQISVGAQIFYAESIEKLIKNMNDCKPHIMTAVPRFYQNLFQKINVSFNKAKGFKKKLVNLTIKLGSKKIEKKNLSFFETILNKVLDFLVRKKIKNQFGGSLKTFVSGGGALNKDVGIFLNSIGLPTLQGYGLTEASPVVSCNPIDDIRIETVGPPFLENEVKIAEDGEILVKGENVMLGYWNNETETKKILKDNWLFTGDIGKFEKNYLVITDRKKDIIITPGGDNISPLKIENELTNSEFIDQAIVFGDSKPFLVALIVPVEDHKKDFNKYFDDELEKINKNLTKIEKIKKFFTINEKFSIENGMLTPTLKLKRYKIINKYKKEFESLY
tara:strand:+ start:1234 stop:2937 length:1704 start_codon:yes stop_codon:yes gene_type:complete